MKTAIIFFAVIFCATFVTARLNKRNLATTTLNVQDFNVFSEALWDTLALGHEYENFESCMHQQLPAGVLLAKAVMNFNSNNTSDVRLGLQRLGKILQVITAAIRKCDGKAMYWKTFQDIVNNFTNPTNLSLTNGSSFTIDGIEVYADMNKAVSYCTALQMGKCGAVLGDALGKVFYGQMDPSSPDAIAKINAIPNITWTAGANPVFNRTNMWLFKKTRVSLRHVHSNTTDNATNATESEGSRRNLATMPTNFDARTNWPYCIHAIRDQGACASCWAVAASEVLSDRFCIASGKSINTILGPQYQVSCDTTNMGCNGGYLSRTWTFLENYGLVTESCFPYTSANFVIPACSSFTKCQDGTTMRKYYAKKGSSKSFSGSSAIQNEIYTNGPVEAAIYVYSDLYNYVSGIYYQVSGSYIGGHAIKIIGWGQQNGVNYWIISNSWGSSWGETGHARIAFGQIGIENSAYAGLADLTRS